MWHFQITSFVNIVSFKILWDNTCKPVSKCLTLMIVSHSIRWLIWCCSYMSWRAIRVKWHCWLVWFIDLLFFLFWILRLCLWAWNRTTWWISYWWTRFLWLTLTNNSSNFIKLCCFIFLNNHLELRLLN